MNNTEGQNMARFITVRWDTTDDNVEEEMTPADCGLPEIVEVPEWMDDCDISDWLSDVWGFCHFGWSDCSENQ